MLERVWGRRWSRGIASRHYQRVSTVYVRCVCIPVLMWRCQLTAFHTQPTSTNLHLLSACAAANCIFYIMTCHNLSLFYHTDGSPQRIFSGHKMPPSALRTTTAFVPAAPILESPHTGSQTPVHGNFGGILSGQGSSGDLQLSGQESPMDSAKQEHRLGSNIYAGNLKMMGKVDSEEERQAAERLSRQDSTGRK